jgi:hypothetical protein
MNLTSRAYTITTLKLNHRIFRPLTEHSLRSSLVVASASQQWSGRHRLDRARLAGAFLGAGVAGAGVALVAGGRFHPVAGALLAAPFFVAQARYERANVGKQPASQPARQTEIYTDRQTDRQIETDRQTGHLLSKALDVIPFKVFSIEYFKDYF